MTTAWGGSAWRPTVLVGAIVALVALLAPSGLSAQMGNRPARDGAARVGLALSGGGAKGFAHIGILRVLEEEGIPVHVIAGTSMGSVVGGLYASGFNVPMVTAMATESDWNAVFLGESNHGSLPIERRVMEERTAVSFPIRNGRITLPSALVSGQGISERLEELTWGVKGDQDFGSFPIPFVALATDLETGEAVALRSGSFADALRASFAIPTVFEPVEIDGRLLVDGGLVRNLPAEDARRLGADILICSDVADDLATPGELQTLAEVAMQTVQFGIVRNSIEQREACDVLLRPDIAGLDVASFDQQLELIARGEAATRSALPQIRRLLEAEPPRPAVARPIPPLFDSITVERLDLVGFERTPESWARRLIGIRAGDQVRAPGMRRAVRRAYATGLFTRVAYRLTPVEEDTNRYVVTIVATEESRDRLGLGFRYESNQKASLLFALSFQNKVRYGSTTRLEARLGEQISVMGSFLSTAHSGTDLTLGLSGSVVRAPLDLFQDDRRIARIDSKTEEITGFAGFSLGSLALAGLTVTGGHSHPGAEVAAADSLIPPGNAYASVGVLAAIDRVDEVVFPRKGLSLRGVAERSIGGGEFSRAFASLRIAVPVSRRISVLAQGIGGVSGGADLPPHYRFYLGGDFDYQVYPYAQHSFHGLKPHQLSGKDVRAVRTTLQIEVRAGWFTGLHWNAGTAGDRLSWPGSMDDLTTGWAASIGTRSPIGPLSATLSWLGDDPSPALSIDLGRRF